jgi:integrase
MHSRARKAERVKLTDARLTSLKAKPTGRYEVIDAQMPGLRVRVSDKGKRTFVLRSRNLNGGARVALGVYPVMPLEEARTKASAWLKLIGGSQDPRELEKRERLAEEKRRKNTFTAVAEDFIADKVSKERKRKEIEREIRNNYIPAWGPLPITDITDDELAGFIKRKASKTPSQARNMLATIKRLFQWAIEQRAYGIKFSPAAQLRPEALCGEKNTGDRVLSDDELFALWRATWRLRTKSKKGKRALTPMCDPFGPAYRMLVLTGLRLNEVADAEWSEFDLPNKLWTIPAVRMKGKNSKARPHGVPITDDIQKVLNDIPKIGKFVFTATNGQSPVWMTSKVKTKIDAYMLRTLRALARKRGAAPMEKLEPWINHDIRRTVRTRLSRLKIAEEVREAVLAHARPGIKKNYDLHEYLDEKREALNAWAHALQGIVEPRSPDNVTQLPVRSRA